MFGSKDEVEMQRRNARIFPDEQIPRAERVGVTVTHKSTKAFADPNNNNRWQNLVLDPSSNIVLTWNRVFLVSCLFALFIDPFFYFIPLFVSTSSLSCVGKDNRLSITITVMRSLADFFYMFNIAVKFNTAYVRPNSRVLGKGDLVTNPNQIRRHYIRSSDFVRDILAAVPVPQILLWGIMPAISASDYNVKNTTFGIVLVFQYAFRMYLIVPLSNKIIKSAGVVANTAWGGAAYNLLLYMLASHITGAIYYLLTVERQITCWNQICSSEKNTTACDVRFLDCDYADANSPTFSKWAKSTGVFNNCNAANTTINFNFGIFTNTLAIGAASTTFHEKYFYCLYWGLQQLSSSGNPLATSTFIAENTFAIAIGAVSLILFAQLIGNMQTYLQSINKRQEDWRLRQRDTEEWMDHHQLPPELKKRVRRFVQVKWFATRGVEEESILHALPSDIRRDVQRHLCLDLVRRVPFFSQMDEQLVVAICERLVSCLCPEGTYVAREGDPVNEMLFIIRGTLESNTTNGGRSNFFNSIRLNTGDFCGEELLTWALMPKTHDYFPTSTRTVKALTEVEAFALPAEDLKFVANQFRRLHSRKLQHTFRFYSHTWRLWAAGFIQAAWRQYKRRKMSESLTHWEETYAWWPEEEKEEDKEIEKEESSSGTHDDGAAQIHKLAPSTSRRFLADDAATLARLQKPDEPDFSADHFD